MRYIRAYVRETCDWRGRVFAYRDPSFVHTSRECVCSDFSGWHTYLHMTATQLRLSSKHVCDTYVPLDHSMRPILSSEQVFNLNPESLRTDRHATPTTCRKNLECATGKGNCPNTVLLWTFCWTTYHNVSGFGLHFVRKRAQRNCVTRPRSGNTKCLVFPTIPLNKRTARLFSAPLMPSDSHL